MKLAAVDDDRKVYVVEEHAHATYRVALRRTIDRIDVYQIMMTNHQGCYAIHTYINIF